MRTYIFGPVPSRRLGISLGVDLTPTKPALSTVFTASFRKPLFTPLNGMNSAILTWFSQNCAKH